MVNPNNPMLELAGDFLLDGQERINHVEEILLNFGEAPIAEREELLVTAKRELHTLKGNSGMMGFTELQDFAHQMEDQVAGVDPVAPLLEDLLTCVDWLRHLMEKAVNPTNDDQDTANVVTESADRLADSIRVPFADLDALVDVLAEMVIFRNRLADVTIKGRYVSNHEQAWDDVEAAETALGSTLNALQNRVMSLRMVPLGSLFVSLKRVVHDVAVAQAKNISFETFGGDTPLDKALLEVASEALGHLIRNAAVHGIEEPNERSSVGKPKNGHIRLVAAAEPNEVLIRVHDDGRGINIDDLLKTAAKRGIDVSDLEDPFSLLFHAGFSTRDSADLDSGRGIGLAAALESVRRLGGRVSVQSEPGAGSTFNLHLPLSVSITRALLVHADDELYALPITHVEENLRFAPGDLTEVNHALVLRRRDEVVPVLDLGLNFATSSTPRRHGFVVIVDAAGKRRGLLIDGMKGIREIVVKGLDPVVGSPPGVSGSTILGDGTVVLILDPTHLVALDTSIQPRRDARRTAEFQGVTS